MRRVIALATVVAAVTVGATSATAGPPTAFEQGAKLCARQGGSFTSDADGYDCYRSQYSPFSERQFSQAQRLCGRNEGSFVSGFWNSSSAYGCTWY
jgi:hypothetical protein